MIHIEEIESYVPSRTEGVGILSVDGTLTAKLQEVVRAAVHEVDVVVFSTLEEVRRELSSEQLGILVIEKEESLRDLNHFLTECKSSNNQPSVIVVGAFEESHVVSELYRMGCQRVLTKQGEWLEEAALAVRHQFRYRQLLEENIKIKTQLTEANMLLLQQNKRLDQFSSTVAHDIRGPLGGITMKLEYLLEDEKGEVQGRLRDILDRALASSRRLTDMVQSMYRFAKLGSEASRVQEVNLTQLVYDVVGDLHFDDSLDIHLGLDTLPIVWGNPDLLRQVFLNLISNAVKYNDSEQVIVNVGTAGIIPRSIGQFCEVYVEDNGIGIAEEDQADIFSMFSRGKHDAGKEGSGIGLAVVRRIMELHYGDIHVESEIGKGSRFTLLLPTEKINILQDDKEEQADSSSDPQ